MSAKSRIEPTNWDNEKQELLESLKKKWCRCEHCGYTSLFRQDMIQHFYDNHCFHPNVFMIDTSKYETQCDYIILRRLVEIAITTENKYKQYITISNNDLHKLLEYHLECKVSNQKPRKVLNEYNLLTRYKNQKRDCIGYDKHSRRIYYINRTRLEEAVTNTPYDNLKLALALIDENEVRIKPLKPLGSKTIDSDKVTKETKELENDDDEWEI